MRSCTETPHLEHSRRRARSAQRYEAYLALNLFHSWTSSLSKVRHRAIKKFAVDCDFSSVSGDDLSKFISKVWLKKSYLLLDMQADQIKTERKSYNNMYMWWKWVFFWPCRDRHFQCYSLKRTRKLNVAYKIVLAIAVENPSRNENTRPPDLPPEKSVCRSRSIS